MPKIDRATQILQKGSAGFADPDYFGTSPDLITAMKNVGVGNLEEQLLLGVNYISYTWSEENSFYGPINKTQKEFRTRNQTDDFYFILDSKPDNVIADDGSFFANGERLFVPQDNGDPTGTGDDNRVVGNTLELKNTTLGDYAYTVEGDVLVISTNRDDLNQFIEQISLWYRPEGATSDEDDKLLAILTVTPEYNLESGKVMQIREIENCWSDTSNDYPKRAEAESTWQIL